MFKVSVSFLLMSLFKNQGGNNQNVHTNTWKSLSDLHRVKYQAQLSQMKTQGRNMYIIGS